ncbi:MAG: hypothetical protein JOZ51_23710 [Chloroflexi bacterium]|nr:hypothetical protein [Chloroflexota bacterium]
MERLSDFSAFAWLQPDISPGRQVYYPMILPAPFEANCRIFHTIWEDLLWDDNASQAAHETYDQREEREVRIRWQTLAERGNIPYTVSIHESHLDAVQKSIGRFMHAGEGYLDETILNPLVELLQPYTGDEACFFFHVFLATHNWNEPDRLYRGKLEDVLMIGRQEHPDLRLTPTYWWPESRRWCVWTDYDNESSYLCGPEQLISEVLAHPYIEALRDYRTS